MAAKPQPLEVGTKAPMFTGVTTTGEKLALKDQSGIVALYFYPKDDTPGCTKQACNLQENMSALKKAKVTVIGVSPDDTDSHQAFTDKFKLKFPLIADVDKKVIDKYGVWGEKMNYGKTFMGLQRVTYLIDMDNGGKIIHVFKRPKTAEHSEEILKKLSDLT